MEDEFLEYLQQKYDQNLIASFNNTDLLLWGERSNGGVNTLGITLTIGTKIDGKKYTPNSKTKQAMNIASKISKESGIQFFVILYPTNDVDMFLTTDLNEPDLDKLQQIAESDMPNLIQTNFNTHYKSEGTLKPVNKSTSDFFHVWSRENLPAEYVKLNIDGLILDELNNPVVFLETKRSFISLNDWKPYEEDSRNYYLQHNFSKNTNLKFWTVYHIKGKHITDNERIALFEISKVDLKDADWIKFNKNIIEAKYFLQRL